MPERIADGGTVVYVDHDPARLADEVSDRWRLADGEVAVRAGAGASPPAISPFAGQTLLVELAGVDPGSLPRLERLPGVLSAATGSAPEILTLTVEERQSDAVLRELLRWDGVHVRSVRP